MIHQDDRKLTSAASVRDVCFLDKNTSIKKEIKAKPAIPDCGRGSDSVGIGSGAISEICESYFHVHHGERALFRAVIMQAITDAVNNSKRTEDKIEKERAIRWFDLRNQDFLFVCSLADYTPEWVFERARNAIKNKKRARNVKINNRAVNKINRDEKQSKADNSKIAIDLIKNAA